MYSQIHALGAADAGPATVRAAEPGTRWAVPAPAAGAGGTALDPAKVQSRLAETARVATLLSGVFAEDDPPAEQPPGECPLSGGPGGGGLRVVAGLDAAHSRLVVVLAGRGEWARCDVEQAAAAVGLPLLDGAFDVINEAAMDACGEPLAEGDDPVVLNDYAIKEML